MNRRAGNGGEHAITIDAAARESRNLNEAGAQLDALQELGCDLWEPEKHGCTAAHYAADSGHAAALRELWALRCPAALRLDSARKCVVRRVHQAVNNG